MKLNSEQWDEYAKGEKAHYRHRNMKRLEDKIHSLQSKLAEYEEVLKMVEDHRLMPHHHKDAQAKLYCLTERASEVLRKHGAL